MKSGILRYSLALALAALGVAIGAAGLYVGEIDDAPGAGLLGIVLMLTALFFALRLARRARGST